MISKRVTLNFKVGFVPPRPFSELGNYEGFVFEKHINMIDPYIQVKTSPTQYAEAVLLLAPKCNVMVPFGDDRFYTIEGDPICYPLF